MKIKPRVISGIYKNRKLNVPESARPVTDRVKRSIFDTISNIIEGTEFLDFFAGSGGMGIEALSRGAKHVTFVESNFEAINTLRENLASLAIPETSYLVKKAMYQDFIKTGKEMKFDIIFLDPPFKGVPRVKIANLEQFCHQETIVIFKIQNRQDTELEMPENFEVINRDEIGLNTVLYFRLKNQ